MYELNLSEGKKEVSWKAGISATAQALQADLSRKKSDKVFIHPSSYLKRKLQVKPSLVYQNCTFNLKIGL